MVTTSAPVASASERRRRLLLAEGVAVLAGLVLLLGQLASRFALVIGTPMNEDLPGWLASARQSSWFYDSGAREPLHAFFLKLALALVSPDERAARLATVVATLLLALATWASARVVLGRVPALLALFLVAANPVVAYYGVAGLREPLQAALGIGLVGAALWMKDRPGAWAPVVVTGVLGAALVLTRRYAAGLALGAPLLAVLLADAPRRNELARGAAVAVAIAVALVLPRALVDGGHGALDLAWFVEHNRALLETPPTGPAPTSFLAALFEGRSVFDVVGLLAANTARLVTWYLPHWLRGYELAWVLVPVGVVVDAWTRRGFVSACAVLGIAPFLPLLHMNPVAGMGGVEMRFIEPFFPFALLLLATPLVHAARRALPLLTAGAPPSRSAPSVPPMVR